MIFQQSDFTRERDKAISKLVPNYLGNTAQKLFEDQTQIEHYRLLQNIYLAGYEHSEKNVSYLRAQIHALEEALKLSNTITINLNQTSFWDRLFNRKSHASSKPISNSSTPGQSSSGNW